MGQVHVQITFTNYRESVLARLGQLDANQVHRYQTEALIDTGAVQSVIPAAVADRLGLMRLRRTDAQYADGRVEAVDLAEVMTIEMLGRQIEMALVGFQGRECAEVVPPHCCHPFLLEAHVFQWP